MERFGVVYTNLEIVVDPGEGRSKKIFRFSRNNF